MSDLSIQEVDEGVVFDAKIVPGSSRTAISGIFGGMLKIKVSAPAEKGKANRELTDFLAGQLGVRKNSMQIITGRTKSVKQIKISGLSPQQTLRKLNLD